MAEDEQYDIDMDSEIEDEDDDENIEQSDDDTGFFPIDDTIVRTSQSNHTTASILPSSKVSRNPSEQTLHKHSTGTSASNTYPQDNNFEYVGQLKAF